jgi:hypothetical protein
MGYMCRSHIQVLATITHSKLNKGKTLNENQN